MSTKSVTGYWATNLKLMTTEFCHLVAHSGLDKETNQALM